MVMLIRKHELSLGWNRRMTPQERGYRSGLEEKIAQQLMDENIPVRYEEDSFQYVLPKKIHRYTPDFIAKMEDGRVMIIETKGRWLPPDRQKILCVLASLSKEQYDFRMVFSNANQKLYKGSKTTYGEWCEKNNIKYAHRTIPDSWIVELKCD